jgi:hypothetical protein
MGWRKIVYRHIAEIFHSWLSGCSKTLELISTALLKKISPLTLPIVGQIKPQLLIVG